MSFIFEGSINFCLVTPEGTKFPKPEDADRGATLSVDLPGVDGGFGVGAAHVPLIAALKPGILIVDRDDSQRKKEFVIEAGFAEVSHRKKEEKGSNVKEDVEWTTDVIVLADMAVPIEEFDRAILATKIKDTEEDLADAADDAARDRARERLDQLKALQDALAQ